LRIWVPILKIRPQRLPRNPPQKSASRRPNPLLTTHAAHHPSGAPPRPSHTSHPLHASRHSRPTNESPTKPTAVRRKSNSQDSCRTCDLHVGSPIDNSDMKSAIHMQNAGGRAPCECDQHLTCRRKSDLRPTSGTKEQMDATKIRHGSCRSDMPGRQVACLACRHKRQLRTPITPTPLPPPLPPSGRTAILSI
jgi:hypothetical protein